jgi:hypothetical protein
VTQRANRKSNTAGLGVKFLKAREISWREIRLEAGFTLGPCAVLSFVSDFEKDRQSRPSCSPLVF